MQRKRHRKTILAAGAILLTLCAALFLGLSMMRSVNRRMNESATTNLSNTTQVIADTLEMTIQRDYDALDVVGAVYRLEGMPETEALAAFRDTAKLDWLGIVDAHGNGTDCLGNVFTLAEYTGAGDWDLREKGYSSAYIGMRSGRMQITLWTPVYQDGAYLGAVLGNVILTQYYSANIFTFYNGDGRTYLIDGADGAFLLRSFGTDGTAARQGDIYSMLQNSGNNAGDIAAFKAAVEGGRKGTATLRFNGVSCYLCFLPLPASPNWYIVTVIARDVLLRESAEVQRIIQWILMLLCIALGIATLIFACWLVRRTKSAEIQYREALFANLSANLDSAFLIYDKAARKTAFVSDNIHRLLGLDRAWLNEDAARLFDWCKFPIDDAHRLAFLNGTLEAPVVQEVCVENELGQNTRTVRLELIPADLRQALAVLTDITKDKDIQRSLVEAMERANAASIAKDNFLSAMSHDLRTPINGIAGMTAIAAAHLDDTDRVQSCLTKISESTLHLLGLVNEVLDMSQIESGKVALKSEPFNIAELLQEVLNVNYPGLQQKNHTVKVRILQVDHEKVIGDSARLTSIVTNLLSNAIKYTPDGGFIAVTLQEKTPILRDYGCYELTVQDNGIGISTDFQQKLFEPFEREDDVRLERIQGTGLGMSIVKNLVDLMMGSIQVESEKGKGSTFRVTLQLRLDEHTEESTTHLTGLPVLVVDDDVDTCKTTTEILCSIGMEGEWTDNGAHAVQMVVQRNQQDNDYMAVLLDWKMPDMDGIETARQIRARLGPTVPIIILTAYDWGEIKAEALEAGVNAFLSKPIYKSKLIHKMTEITEGKLDATGMPRPLSGGKIPPGRRVLLAEDNALNAEITVELLRMMGIETDCTTDGVEVTERFANTAPGTYDMVLMDIQMPRMDGYDAARAIRAMERPDAQTIPIVAMTADAFKRDRQSAYEAGMNEHLSKPISVDRLAFVMKQFLAGTNDSQKESNHEKD